jgi:hypothetical protein
VYHHHVPGGVSDFLGDAETNVKTHVLRLTNLHPVRRLTRLTFQLATFMQHPSNCKDTPCGRCLPPWRPVDCFWRVTGRGVCASYHPERKYETEAQCWIG